MNAHGAMDALQTYASDVDAANLQWFFKTGPGQYGEGDEFIGVRAPAVRKVAKEYKKLPLSEVSRLIKSPIHEHRMCGLIILTLQYPRSEQKQAIYDLYIDMLHAGFVNNWDLVDVTCRAVIGAHLHNNRGKLYELAKSDNLWERRVAIVATFPYIWEGDPTTTLELAEILLHDPHDLIHKAVGWAIREIGNRCDEALLLDFLDRHAHTMPRVALRYAIEKLTPATRAHYLAYKG